VLRRFTTGLVVVVFGLLAFGGTAAAAPTYASATISVTYNGGDQYTVILGNFGLPDGADASIDLSITYGAPSGLRGSPALAAAAAKDESYTFVPNADGNYTAVVHVTQSGRIYFTATGYPSGKTASTSVVHPSGAAEAAGGKADSAGSQDYGKGEDLATTGTSIAGPIAIGVLALAAGLALLFFGTRGVSRRKSVKYQQ
jgi:hypothetical protein